MSTKAQDYRYEQERSGPKREPRRWTKHGSRRGGTGLTAHRGPTKKLWAQSSRPLEASAERRYSRVSKRGAINSLKPSHPQRDAAKGRIRRDTLKARALSKSGRSAARARGASPAPRGSRAR